jgi:hypothetical protein
MARATNMREYDSAGLLPGAHEHTVPSSLSTKCFTEALHAAQQGVQGELLWRMKVVHSSAASFVRQCKAAILSRV